MKEDVPGSETSRKRRRSGSILPFLDSEDDASAEALRTFVHLQNQQIQTSEAQTFLTKIPSLGNAAGISEEHLTAGHQHRGRMEQRPIRGKYVCSDASQPQTNQLSGEALAPNFSQQILQARCRSAEL